MIVDLRRRDVRVSKPLLHLSDVGLMIERVSCGRCPQRMHPDLESKLCRVGAHELIDAVGRDRLVERSRSYCCEAAETARRRRERRGRRRRGSR